MTAILVEKLENIEKFVIIIKNVQIDIKMKVTNYTIFVRQTGAPLYHE